MPNPPLVAVDTNFLIDLAAKTPVAIDCFEALRKKFPSAPIFILPTVITEITDLALNGGTQRIRVLATEVIRKIRVWGFQPINCVPVGHGIVEQTARKIRDAGLLPVEEIHDSFIIAEAALVNVTVLISSDSHLKDIDHAELQVILERCDLANTTIVPPAAFIKLFGNR